MGDPANLSGADLSGTDPFNADRSEADSSDGTGAPDSAVAVDRRFDDAFNGGPSLDVRSRDRASVPALSAEWASAWLAAGDLRPTGDLKATGDLKVAVPLIVEPPIIELKVVEPVSIEPPAIELKVVELLSAEPPDIEVPPLRPQVAIDPNISRFFGESPFATPLAGEPPSAPFYASRRPVVQAPTVQAPIEEPDTMRERTEELEAPQPEAAEFDDSVGPDSYQPRYNSPRPPVIKIDPAALANRPNSAADGWLLPPGGPATGRRPS